MRNKAALITGGATGIGKRTAYVLAAKGIDLVINYRSSQKEAVSLCRELTKEYGTKNIALQGDISIPAECVKMSESAFNEFPVIDIVIHNAGPYVHERKEMMEYTFEQWNYLINGNLNAVFYLSKLFIPKMREAGWGRIITIGFDRVESASGWIYRSAFAAAKTGAASLTKSIALEEAGNGITANMVCPGDIVGEWKEKKIEEAAEVQENASPVGRPGTGEDIARVISFLTDEKSDFITGSIIPVTGGKDVLGKIYQE
ncbi:SDR family oxidoreductase [Cytobacillus sp. FSL W8-0315]|uniref:SDR family oxidoreductase n=1 Tax=Cytobacillus sp. FSL W8-0315 TaxID=2921600 RepID=UPI0030FBA7EA